MNREAQNLVANLPFIGTWPHGCGFRGESIHRCKKGVFALTSTSADYAKSKRTLPFGTVVEHPTVFRIA